MPSIPMTKFNLNRFFEKLPTALKYLFIIAVILVSSYFIFTTGAYKNQNDQIKKIEDNIEVTYTLINNFEDYKHLQDEYNGKILNYLVNLHTLVEELSDNTNRKLDIILKSSGKNKEDVVDKISILNESFSKLSRVYDISKEKQNAPTQVSTSDEDLRKYNINAKKIK
jgi:hypothetical protein